MNLGEREKTPMEKEQGRKQKEEQSTQSQEINLTALEKGLDQMGAREVPVPEGIRVRIYPAPQR
jgi:hypothetical protein